MAEDTSCLYCGHPNPADAMFCQACSRVLEDPGVLGDQKRKTYLDQDKALVTETSAFLYGKTYPISEIQEVEIIERIKDRKNWGLGLILFGAGTILEGLFEKEWAFSLAWGAPCLLLGALLAAVTNPTKEEAVSVLWITTRDGTEQSLTLEGQAEARAILEAITRSCSDQGAKRESSDL